MTNEFPTTDADARELFALDQALTVPAFAAGHELSEWVPEIDSAYRFNSDVARAILAGFVQNRRVMIQGWHGTGKSTHIEQVAARLNWPLVRVNLDGHVSRLDLVGRDAIVVEDGKQITRFQEGILPWALQRPVAILFDEYDAGRPEVMFVLQRLLEREGRFTLLDQNRVIQPHPQFRLFSTANTVGLGNLSGLYHGAQQLNQAQIDRWSVVARLDWLPPADEAAIVSARVPTAGAELVAAMVEFAGLTRRSWVAGDLSTLMSPRTVITWAENLELFGGPVGALAVSFVNKCDAEEHPIIDELHQRVFGTSMHAVKQPDDSGPSTGQ